LIGDQAIKSRNMVVVYGGLQLFFGIPIPPSLIMIAAPEDPKGFPEGKHTKL
jgi:hypothetical protein